MIKSFSEVSRHLISEHKVQILHEDTMPKEDLIALDYFRAGERAYYEEEYKIAYASYVHWIGYFFLLLLGGGVLMVAGVLGIIWGNPDVLQASYWVRFAVAVVSMIAGIICVVIAVSTGIRRARAVDAIAKYRKEKTTIYEIKDIDLNSAGILDSLGSSRVLFRTVMQDENLLSGKHSYVVIVRAGNEPFIIEQDLALAMKSSNSLVGIYMIARHEVLRDVLAEGGAMNEENK